MTLMSLAAKVEICNYDFVFWFKGAELKGDVLVVENAPCGRYITNCWGARMREHIPGLRIVVKPEVAKASGQAKPSILNAKGRKWEAERQAAQVRLGDLD